MIFEKQIINMYKSMAYTRCDDNGTAFYFSAEDFPNLKSESFSFKSSLGHTLSGCFYFYDNPKEKRIIVFEHGFGSGHSAYMKEIEKLAKHGYLVFSYDHTGCMQSGGTSPNGMAQSLADLNDCITALKSVERLSEFDISVVGHSWGGFSTLNIPSLHPDISHIVVFSGFVSVHELIKSYFPSLLMVYRKPIMELERAANPKFVYFNAVNSLKNSNVKALLIYSENDKLCSKKHYEILKNGLVEKQNIKTKLVFNKGHNPNYTTEAVKHLNEYLKAKSTLMKKKKLVTDEQKRAFLLSFDWNRMTEQDESVWEDVFECLDN